MVTKEFSSKINSLLIQSRNMIQILSYHDYQEHLVLVFPKIVYMILTVT